MKEPSTDLVERSPATQAQLSTIDRQVRWMSRTAVVLGAVGGALAVWAISTVGFAATNLGTLGTLLAGTVAPVWSLAGLVLIYLAFLGQRRQIVVQEEGIDLNRQELRDTREELRGQKEQLELQRSEMEIQNDTMRKQAFEQSFFELLQFHRQLAGDLTARPNAGADYHGQGAFIVAVAEIAGRLAVQYQPEPTRAQWLDHISAAFRDVCLAPASDFGSYFRTIYHIVRHVDESGLPDRPRYVALLRAQLSNAELILLFADGLSDVGREKFKPLIEKYGLLEPVRLPEQLQKFKASYSPLAFMSIAPGDSLRMSSKNL